MNDQKTQAQPPEPVAKAPAKAAAPKRKREPEAVARAGGYVDRGDGNGWVLEEE